jgi:hypothetical protein
MTDRMRNTIRKPLLLAAQCLVIGILGGLPLSAIEGFQKILWSPFSLYNIEIVSGLQMIGSFFLGLLIIGAISFRITNADDENHFQTISHGGLAGLGAGLAFFFIQFVYPGSFPLHSASTIPIFIVGVLEISVISLIFGSTGAYFLKIWDHRQKKLYILKRPGRFSGRASRFIIPFILIFLLTFGPPLITYTVIWAGAYEKSYACGGMWNSPGRPFRVSDDSIIVPQYHKQISDKPDYHNWFPASTPRNRCEIFINKIEMSNVSIIRGQGLQDTINPPEGLNDPYNRETVLKGPSFVGNGTNPPLITVDGISNGNRFHYYQNLEI